MPSLSPHSEVPSYVCSVARLRTSPGRGSFSRLVVGCYGPWPYRLGLILLAELCGLRYIPNNRVGIVEKLWSAKGSVPEGRIIALNGEAGFQADLLRGGIHFGLWRWQYRIHKVPLVTVPQGKIGYVYARDGEPLPPSQTLGRVVACNNFQDARAFLSASRRRPTTASRVGQRGRQRAILREGVYAINLALFVVITEDTVYRLRPPAAQRELRDAAELAERAAARSTASARSSSAARSRRPTRSHPSKTIDGRQHRHRHGPRRPVAAARRDHRPGGRHRARTTRTTTTTTRTPRRSSAPAAAAAGSTCR